MPDSHRPLLGRLARWFNEVIATDALRSVLDDPVVRSAFLDFVGNAASTDLSEVRAFERERPTADGRMDLEGVDAQGRPRLVIEAKFGHLMSVDQMSKYLAHQNRQLAGAVPGVLMLLVPDGRLAQARAIMNAIGSAGPDHGTDMSRIEPIALSWEDCLSAIESATSAQPVSPVSPAADLAQLRALCEELSGWTRPVVEIPDDERTEFLKVVLEQLKDRVPSRNTGPRVARDPDYLTLRYFGVPGAASYYSIGLTHRFAESSTPVWLRFHKATNDFQEVKKRLRRSEFAEQIRQSRGHIWLPLNIEPDLGGPELVGYLVAQVERIANVVAPSGDAPDPLG
jgi:hypothetical protein